MGQPPAYGIAVAWVQVMEVRSLAEQLLFTTARISTTGSGGASGVATAFVVRIERNGKVFLFLVTNKHVVLDARTVHLHFTVQEREQPAMGKIFSVEMRDIENSWAYHGDADVDVAVAPFGPVIDAIQAKGVQVFFRTLGQELVPTAEAIREIDAVEDVVFIGYPNGVWDEVNNLPVVRKGITATPIAVDFRGKKQFLVDASVFPGSSGSPVFLYNPGTYVKKDQC